MQEAMSEYKQLISLDPGFTDAHKQLAETLKRVGLYNMAEKEMEIYKNLTKNMEMEKR